MVFSAAARGEYLYNHEYRQARGFHAKTGDRDHALGGRYKLVYLAPVFNRGRAHRNLFEWYIYIYLQKRVLSDAMRMIRIISFSNISSWLLFGFAAIGILTGVIGSLISMRRYLKA